MHSIWKHSSTIIGKTICDKRVFSHLRGKEVFGNIFTFEGYLAYCNIKYIAACQCTVKSTFRNVNSMKCYLAQTKIKHISARCQMKINKINEIKQYIDKIHQRKYNIFTCLFQMLTEISYIVTFIKKSLLWLMLIMKLFMIRTVTEGFQYRTMDNLYNKFYMHIF